MQLKRLGHVAICVQDIPKAVEFYQSLGMQLAWQDADWAYLKAGTDGLALLSPEYKQAANHFGYSSQTWLLFIYTLTKIVALINSLSNLTKERSPIIQA